MNTRPICSKEWLLELCAAIANRPELTHLYDPERAEDDEWRNAIDIGDLDLEEDYPQVYNLPNKFRVLFPDTYLKLKFIWQNLVELRDQHTFAQDHQLIKSIDGEPLSGLVFSFQSKNEIERWEQRTKMFHDIVDDAEARIAAIHPNRPMKLKRFPFAFGDWMHVVQSEDGTKSVAVCTGGPLGGDMGSWIEFIMVNPDPATPDTPYPFGDMQRDQIQDRVGVEYTWLSGPVLMEYFAHGIVSGDYIVELMDHYIKNEGFAAGDLNENMADIRVRFDEAHPEDAEK